MPNPRESNASGSSLFSGLSAPYNPDHMLQELFRIPGLDLPIYGYGLMMVVGFLAGAYLAKYLADRIGLDGEAFFNAALLGLFSGVVGARLSHVLENLHEFFRPDYSLLQTFLAIINLKSGGLTFYGGFLLAFPTLVIFARLKKIPLRTGMDIIAPCLMVGLAFGRVGCFLNGCCYGAECALPWHVEFPYHSNAYVDHFYEGKLEDVPPQLLLQYGDRMRVLSKEELAEVKQIYNLLQSKGPGETRDALAAMPRYKNPDYLEAMLRHAAKFGSSDFPSLTRTQHSQPVHPAQLYSALNAFLIAAVCYAYFTLPHAAGRAFALMLMLKGTSRFLLEMLRVEPPVLGAGSGHLESLPPLSLSMVISVGLVVLGTILWLVFGKLAPEPEVLPAGLPASV